jgi:mannose-6-phosphate isomerase-like protein (cupin superfamily)
MAKQRAGFALASTYVQLLDGLRAETVEVDENFWSEIDARKSLHRGRLVGLMRMARGEGDHSEMHPAGDELLILLSGAADVILEERGGERAISLAAGEACVVPRGTWHHFHARRAGELLFVTPGRGTRARAR